MAELEYLIAKAERDSEYRASWINSLPGKRERALDTHYRRGGKAWLRRTGRTTGYGVGSEFAGNVTGGSLGGTIGGAIAGARGRNPREGAKIGAGVGSIVGGGLAGVAGQGVARNRNIESGDIKFIGRGKHAGRRVTRMDPWSNDPRFERRRRDDE